MPPDCPPATRPPLANRSVLLSKRSLALVACALGGLLSPATAGEAIAAQAPETVKASSADEAHENTDIASLRAALEEYALAIRDGDARAILARTHENVARRRVDARYWGRPSREWIRPVSREMLAASVARSADAEGRTGNDADTRPAPEILIDDLATRSASARLLTGDRFEAVHAVHLNGRWLVADACIGPTATLSEKERDDAERAIIGLITDYCQGFYEKDGERVRATCHPILSKRAVERFSEDKPEFLSRITYEEIEILGEEFNTYFNYEPGVARMEIEVYDIRDGIATARLTGESWFDYFQFLRVNGAWRIVNIIYESLEEN